MIVSIFKNIFKSKDVPYFVPIEKVADRIKNGASKERINSIRKEKDKQKRNQLKMGLPSIVFSGEFSQRNSNSLIKHSGLMVLDFDDFKDEESLNNQRELLKKNNHVFLLFTSPSGNGLKVVIKVSNKLNKDTHPKVFKQFNKEFNYDNFDVNCSNIDRVCYESYDPDIYKNYNSITYDPEILDDGYNFTEKTPLIPISDDAEKINKISKFNFNNKFQKGSRNNFILDLSSQFCEYGVNQSSAEEFILNNYIDDDFTEREALNTIKSAYRIRSFGIKYFENYNKINSLKLDLKLGKKRVLEKYKITEEVYNDVKKNIEVEDFWEEKQNKNGDVKISVNPLKYKIFLESNGFKKYFPNDTQKPTWVYIFENKVSEIGLEKIKDFVLKYLEDKKLFNVWNYCSSYHNLFSEQFLLMLESIELKMLKDTKDKSFIAFNNGVLEVTKNSQKLIDFLDIDCYLWKNQIINRDYKEVKNNDNDYKSFIKNISDNNDTPIRSVIGYMISTYKNKTNNKAVIINDEVISDNPEGGTGKGLFVQGLKEIRKVSILDGKTFDDKKSFPYQTVSQETNILVFDDVSKNFNFENKFSLVTEGLTLERKNKDAIKLSVEESPKMLITTNYAIKGEGNSHDRRRHEMEFTQYYNGKRTPYDEFGKQLFDDWNDKDYLAFDNYMVECLQIFLENGLISQHAKNVKMRKFIAETSMEFNEWVSDVNNFGLNIRHNKKIKFNEFIEEYQDYKKSLSQKKFRQWVEKYAKFKDFKYLEGNTQGERWFEVNNGLNENEDELLF